MVGDEFTWELKSGLVQPAPVVMSDGRGKVDVKTVFLPGGRQEVEEAIHLAVPVVEGGGVVASRVAQKHRTLVPLTTKRGDGGGRVHRGRSQLVCSDSSLMMEERAEGATRCRDVSIETFANRASSQVGSDASSNDSDEADEAVGAGERGRSRLGAIGEDEALFKAVVNGTAR